MRFYEYPKSFNDIVRLSLDLCRGIFIDDRCWNKNVRFLNVAPSITQTLQLLLQKISKFDT